MELSTLAHQQWRDRPDDERFTSLTEMLEFYTIRRRRSASHITDTQQMHVPTIDYELGINIGDVTAIPNNWAFTQLCASVGAHASYLRTLPTKLAAQCLEFNIKDTPERRFQALVTHNDGPLPTLGAVTGPDYGRVWNYEIISELYRRFGDGVTSTWRVPGEFGKQVVVDKDNTTLYGSDRDIFVFLCNEDNKIEVPKDNNGDTELLSRGFYVWNSEVGSTTFGIAMFLFRYVCCNRIVWGMRNAEVKSYRHTRGAPTRYIEEFIPTIMRKVNDTTQREIESVRAARARTLNDEQVVDVISKHFGPRFVDPIVMIHAQEELRPIRNYWDVVMGATAYARSIPYQDKRVAFERIAGTLLPNA